MAKYILKEMNDVRNTGERKVYPKLVVNYTVGKDEFVDRVQKHLRAIDKGVVIAVTTGVADVLAELLSEGCNVTIDEIGTFSTSLRFFDDKPTEIESDDDSMAYRRVGVKDINFKTAPEMMRSLQMRTKFERVMTGARLLKKNLYTLEQRIENALAKISSDPNMPIDYTGQASHKIWIRRKGVNC